jgi:hypothetical protein
MKKTGADQERSVAPAIGYEAHLLAGGPVYPFAQEVKVAAVPGGLFDHVGQDIPQVEIHLRAACHLV